MYTISGEPIPWKAHKGYGKRSYSPNHDKKNAAKWELMIQHADAQLYDKPVRLCFEFLFPFPKSTAKKVKKRAGDGETVYHKTRPDLTNLQKFAEDCLTGTVITDDNLVVDIRSTKYYSDSPCTIIQIEEV